MGKEETAIRHHTSAHQSLTTSVAALQHLSNQGTSLQIAANAVANPHQAPVRCKAGGGKQGHSKLFWQVSCAVLSGVGERTESEVGAGKLTFIYFS